MERKVTALFVTLVIMVTAGVAASPSLNLVPALGSGANSACSGYHTAPPSMNSNLATVYFVTADRAEICVTYRFDGAGTANFSTVVEPWVQSGIELTYPLECLPTGCQPPTITASPRYANHGAGAEVTVEYTVWSSVNTTGLYAMVHAGCDPLYLSFGSVPSSVYLQAWTCGPANVLSGGFRSDNYSVIGTDNIQVDQLPWT